MYVCSGWCNLELAQVPTRVALALHIAGRGAPIMGNVVRQVMRSSEKTWAIASGLIRVYPRAAHLTGLLVCKCAHVSWRSVRC